MTVTTVNPKGQVTIPEPLRTKYGFPPGTKVIWIEREGEIIPHPLLSISQLRGYLKRRPGEPSLAEEIIAEHRAEREREDGL